MREHNPVLVASHAQHIYDFDAKPFATPQSPVSVTRAFGARAPEKLIGQLKSPELIIRQKALLAAHQLLSSKFSYEECVAAGITSPLSLCLQDRDNIVRQRAASCLTLVGRKATGVRKVLTCGALQVLLDLLQDADLPARDAAYGCMEQCCRHTAMQEAVADTNSALCRILTMVQTESAERATRGLTILLACALGGEHKDNGLEQLIIQGEAFSVLRTLIMKGKSASVQEGATRLLARLCSTPEAREQAVEGDLVTALLPCLTQGSVSLACSAVEALMQITIAVQGKQAMVLSGQLPLLIELLDGAAPYLTACLVELICNCGELLAAKKELQAAIPPMQEIARTSTSLRTQQSAVQALQRLTLVPQSK